MLDMNEFEIDRLLEDSLIGRLSMADTEGRPYTIPLPYCWTEGAIYLRLAMTGRKGEILNENNRVCFEVDEFSETLDAYASVLLEGRLVEVSRLDEKAHVKSLNDEKYHRLRQGHRPGHGRATPLEQLPMRKLVVDRVSGRKRASAAVPVG